MKAWQAAFPVSYRDLVERYGREFGIEPYLVWALMTYESAHNPYAVSRAHARGLLQIIPRTGFLATSSCRSSTLKTRRSVESVLRIVAGDRPQSSLAPTYWSRSSSRILRISLEPKYGARWLSMCPSVSV